MHTLAWRVVSNLINKGNTTLMHNQPYTAAACQKRTLRGGRLFFGSRGTCACRGNHDTSYIEFIYYTHDSCNCYWSCSGWDRGGVVNPDTVLGSEGLHHPNHSLHQGRGVDVVAHVRVGVGVGIHRKALQTNLSQIPPVI